MNLRAATRVLMGSLCAFSIVLAPSAVRAQDTDGEKAVGKDSFGNPQHKVIVAPATKENHDYKFLDNGDFVIYIDEKGDHEAQLERGLKRLSLEMMLRSAQDNKKAGHYKQAEEDLKNAITGAHLINDDRALLRTLSLQGALLRLQDKLPDARAAYKECLPLAEEIYGKKSVDVANISDDLALVEDDMRNFSEGEDLHKKSLVIYREVEGEDGNDVAIALNNLASSYKTQKRFDEAIESFNQALEIEKKSKTQDQVMVATTIDNLGATYSEQGDYKHSEEKRREALKIYMAQLGPQHVDTAICQSNLAWVLYQQHKYDEALTLYKEALAVEKKSFGVDHPSVKALENGMENCQRESASDKHH